MSEKAGPCGTLTFNEYTKDTVTASCENYYLIKEGTCADSCINDYLGFCPRSIIVDKAGLKQGECSSLGYTKAASPPTSEIHAGPCGTLEFHEYTKASFALQSDSGCLDSIIALGQAAYQIVGEVKALASGNLAAIEALIASVKTVIADIETVKATCF